MTQKVQYHKQMGVLIFYNHAKFNYTWLFLIANAIEVLVVTCTLKKV